MHQHLFTCAFARSGAVRLVVYTVRDCLVRGALPCMLGEIPDDAFQFDDVFLSWLSHTSGHLF